MSEPCIYLVATIDQEFQFELPIRREVDHAINMAATYRTPWRNPAALVQPQSRNFLIT